MLRMQLSKGSCYIYQSLFNIQFIQFFVSYFSSSKGFLKVVCFTRSSQAVSQLAAAGDTSPDNEGMIEEIVVASNVRTYSLAS